MHTKHRYTLIDMAAALLAAIILAACNDSHPLVYKTDDTDYSVPESQEQIAGTPIKVAISEQDMFQLSTRGGGEIDGPTSAAALNGVFYVFAFRDGEDINGTLTTTPDLRMTRLAAASAPGYDDSADQTSCLLDGTDYSLGMPCKIAADASGSLVMQDVADDGTLTERTTDIYYSSTYPDAAYNFFAFYIDDMSHAGFHRDADRIYYDLTIDGTRDIMTGVAPEITSDMFSGAGQYANVEVTNQELATILRTGKYSKFSADRGIVPVVPLKHKLTQVTFTAYPGDESANDIVITGISLTSKYRGSLVVAARDTAALGITFTDDKTTLQLREASADGITPCAELGRYTLSYDETMKDYPWYQRPGTRVGGGLIVAPDTAYTLEIDYTQTIDLGNGQTDTKYITSKYTLRAQDNEAYLDTKTGEHIFLPGNKYNVSIAVYGLKTIQVGVDIENWKEGATIFIDPEQIEEYEQR